MKLNANIMLDFFLTENGIYVIATCLITYINLLPRRQGYDLLLGIFRIRAASNAIELSIY